MEGKKKVLFYGAGVYAAVIYRHARQKSELYGEPVAFIDRDPYKRGHDLFGLPIFSWEDARERYGDSFYVYVTAEPRVAPDIISFLLEQSFSAKQIINYEPVEKRLGCRNADHSLVALLDGSYVYYRGCNAIGDNLSYKDITLACRVELGRASHPDELKKSVNTIRDMNNMISGGACEGIYENCRDCIDRKMKYYFSKQKLRRFNICGTVPCNYKCCYCCQDHEVYEKFRGEAYPLSRKILHALEQEGLIDGDTCISIGAGEFTANVGGNELVAEMAGKYPLLLLTNGYLFSLEAAGAIKQSGAILCDLDAGTPESYRKIKGVDGFKQVSEHIREYAKYGPIILKYILLEGMNDSPEDLEGFFKLADEIATRVDLTRDFLNISGRFSDNTLRFAAKFIKHFRDKGKLNMSMAAFVRSGEGERLNRILEEL